MYYKLCNYSVRLCITAHVIVMQATTEIYIACSRVAENKRA